MSEIYTLHSMRYFEPITEDFPSLDRAINRSSLYLQNHYASPQKIMKGKLEVMDQEDLFNAWFDSMEKRA